MNVGEINYYTHSNKTNCVFVDNKDLPLISIDIWCKAGSAFEDLDKSGTAHFLEHMIFKGSNKIMPGEFDHRIESLGGVSNAATGYDDSHYYVLTQQNNFKESLALLTNIVLSPEINLKEFNIEKNVIIDEIKQQNDQPDEKLFNYFLSRVWESNNYGKPILGTEKNIQLLKKNDLVNFHRKQYNNENICIAIAGNLNEYIYKTFKENNFSFKNQISTSNKKISNPIVRTGREKINFENIEFSRIFMAWRIPSSMEQHFTIGLEILASILSVGRHSRLVKVLKEEKDLVESIYVDVNVGEFGGLLILEACCDEKHLECVEENINKIINEILNYKNITLRELKMAVNIVKSNYIFNLETSTQLSSFFGNELLWGRRNSIENLEKYLDHWNNLDNFKAITKYLTKDNYTLIVSAGND